MHLDRQITYAEAIREATDHALGADPNVYLMGEGVPDPKAIFGTTAGLQEKYGKDRVYDMPVSENGGTGFAIGTAVVGMRPILVHQRIDFTLYAMDQTVNNAAKWYSMFGGQSSCPMVIRTIIGRGWGQGNQHSQNLQTLYAHVPGLKVIAPATAYAAKGMMLAAVRDNNPVLFLEHRWLHNTVSNVPEESYEVELGKTRVAREGKDITLVAWSYMTQECLKAADFLEKQGVSVEVLDVQTLKPMDTATIKLSLLKTKNLLVVDAAWKFSGLAGEILATMAEDVEVKLDSNPQRLTFPDYPSPSTPGLAQYYYTTPMDIFEKICKMLAKSNIDDQEIKAYMASRTHDIPDQTFKGPF